MTKEKIAAVKTEMGRLAKRIKEFEDQQKPEVIPDKGWSRRRPHWSTVAESGAVKRASMDLSRALADLRRPR